MKEKEKERGARTNPAMDGTAKTIARTGEEPSIIDPNAETLISQPGVSAPSEAPDQKNAEQEESRDKVAGKGQSRGQGRLSNGDMVGEYQVTHLLGVGGMGEVYAGEHPVIGKKVAIKVLNRALCSVPEMVRRFSAEAKAVNRINHHNIVDIFSFGELEDGSQYFVMELLEGETFTKFMNKKAPLTYGDAKEILEQLCDALAAAHEADVVHRDLKPDNMILSQDRRQRCHLKLLDFGIARFFEDGISLGRTQTGIRLGTPLYMAPEQGAGEHVDHRADIYALGVIMYQMFTGRTPFISKSYIEILQAHSFQPPPPPGRLAELPTGLEELILWTLEKAPSARPESVAILWERLENILCRLDPESTPILSQTQENLSQHESKSKESTSSQNKGSPPSQKSHGNLQRPNHEARSGNTTREVSPLQFQDSKRRLTLLLGVGLLMAAMVAGGLFAWYLSTR